MELFRRMLNLFKVFQRQNEEANKIITPIKTKENPSENICKHEKVCS